MDKVHSPQYMSAFTSRRFILKLSCPDRVGIVAAVSGFLAGHNGWIIEAHNHADPESGRFFMRQEVLSESLGFDAQELRRRFEPVAERFDMDWSVGDSGVPRRVIVLVSRQTHCLDDLLHRWRSGDMRFDLRAVVSNHDDSRGFVEWHKVPYHLVPIQEGNEDGCFRRLDRVIEESQAEVIVLARYMRVLPAWMCQKHPERIINIHHSFLPSFVGARPHQQAHQRGVKFVGATCHYVTESLDDGPIIEQDAIRTNHADTVEEVTRIGRDVEKTVLARGLRYHLEDRVLLNGRRTVVFQ
jgi:formyltetrahydrofolate deformylase